MDTNTLDEAAPVPYVPTEVTPDEFADLSDRELLLMVVAWQRKADEAIEGMVAQAKGLLDNPMIQQLTGMMG